MFQNFVHLPYEDGIEKYLDNQNIGDWKEFRRKFPKVHLKRLFGNIPPKVLTDLIARAVERNDKYRPPNFFGYYAVDCYGIADTEELVKNLEALEIIEFAYREAGPTVPPLVNQSNDPRFPNQNYLTAAPIGIDAIYAWGFSGGDGAGIGFVDCEQGWRLGHEDLVDAGITIISGSNHSFFGHGTSVLGEVVAVDNSIGCIGAAMHANTRVISQWQFPGPAFNTAQAITDAAAHMNIGDVLLLEAQTTVGFLINNQFLAPVEIEPAVFDAIQLATAGGIIVVEAAGNGKVPTLDNQFPNIGLNLDTINRLNRSDPAFSDSGAIIVGAASSNNPHSRLGFSNFGNRVDCYAWGENIDTTGDPVGDSDNSDYTYTSSFSGTSGASPLIAAAALIVQGISSANFGTLFTPEEIRSILSDPTNGTVSNNPSLDKIGVMPDLKKIIDNVLQVSQDSYIRDFVGDIGDPHTNGNISRSPDIIVRSSQIADPQGMFGAGSGTENNDNLSTQVEFGQDNYIYLRVLNRGGEDAANLTGTLYWSPVSTLVTPSLWNFIGNIVIPSVPSGNILTVSDAITWQASQIPDIGHYCFVALIGNEPDPTPLVNQISSWDNYIAFIQNNNNAAWRNFNVVDNTPAHGEFIRLPFLICAAPDKARRFKFEVCAHLPKSSKVFLEIPYHAVKQFYKNTSYINHDKKHRISRIPIKNSGNTFLSEVELQKDSKFQCRLLVQIPRACRKNSYNIYIRQIFEKVEVGRVSWLLTPPKKK